MTDLRAMVSQNEKVLWQSKPCKLCYVLEGIFNPMLLVALVWGGIDLGFMKTMLETDTSSMGTGIFGTMGLFFLLHLMPVWIYLIGAIGVFIKYKHTEYIVTDKGVYISGGLFTFNYEMKPFQDLATINMHRGIIDQLTNTGDVIMISDKISLVTNAVNNNRNNRINRGFIISDIKDYQEVFKLIKQLQTDVYSDTMFPNDMRPKENHGYQTTYANPDVKPINVTDDFSENR